MTMGDSRGETLRDRLTKATLLITLVGLISRVLGYLRDAVIAYKFGLEGEPSAYYAAIHVPDILNYLVAGGTLSSTFVPLFKEYWQRQRQSAAWAFFAVVASLILVLIVTLVILFEIFAEPLVHFMYGPHKGIKGLSPEQLELAVRITRIVLPAQIFFVIGGLINGVIFSIRGDDKWYVAMPTFGALIYNVGIIAGGLMLANSHGIVGFAWGGLVGAFVGPFLLVALAAQRAGAQFRFSLNLRHPGIRRYILLTLPLMVAVSYSFVDQIIASILGARLPDGSIAALNNAYRLMLVPVGIIGMAAATAAVGTLAGLAAENDVQGFRQQIREAMGRVGVMVFPIIAVMIVLAPALVRILYQHGQFDADDTARVASLLRWYALGIYAWSVNYVLARGMYSLQDTITPAVLGTLTTLLIIPLSILLMRPMGAEGLALATTLGISLQSLAIFLALRKKLRGLHAPAIGRSLKRMMVSAGLTALVCWGVQQLLHAIPTLPATGDTAQAALARLSLLAPASGSIAGALLEVGIVAGIGIPLFAVIAVRLGEEEAAHLWGKIFSKATRLLRRSGSSRHPAGRQ